MQKNRAKYHIHSAELEADHLLLLLASLAECIRCSS